MTAHVHDRALALGFAMAYFGVMGLLLMMSSPNLSEEAERTIRLGLAALAGLGMTLLALAKLVPTKP